jgi:hypothetical protein
MIHKSYKASKAKKKQEQALIDNFLNATVAVAGSSLSQAARGNRRTSPEIASLSSYILRFQKRPLQDLIKRWLNKSINYKIK